MPEAIEPGDVFLDANGTVHEIEQVRTIDGRGHYDVVNYANGDRSQVSHTELMNRVHSNKVFFIKTRDIR